MSSIGTNFLQDKIDELQTYINHTLSINAALQSKLFTIRADTEKECKLLRESVLVLQSQLQQSLMTNTVLRSAILQSEHLSQSVIDILKAEYSVAITCKRKNGETRCIMLPIKDVVFDTVVNTILIFYSSGLSTNHNIFLCSSWSIEIIPTRSDTSCPVLAHSDIMVMDDFLPSYPPLASFTKENIRLQTDDGKQIQVFDALGQFLGASMTCTFTITTRNIDKRTDGMNIKRDKRCVFLTTFSLKISMTEYRHKLTSL